MCMNTILLCVYVTFLSIRPSFHVIAQMAALCSEAVRSDGGRGNVKMFSVTTVKWIQISLKFSSSYRKRISLLKSIWKKKVIHISALWIMTPCSLVPGAHIVARLWAGRCGVWLPVRVNTFFTPPKRPHRLWVDPVSDSKERGALSPGIKRSWGLRSTAFTSVFKTPQCEDRTF